MRRADRRKYHYIYKITRFDGKYYIGFHSTDDLEDGYFGSGKRLRNSVNYHGKDKHTLEIVEFLPDRKSLKKREAELVTEDHVNDLLCMNLKKGGEGGWNHINDRKDQSWRSQAAHIANSIKHHRMKTDSEYRQTFCERSTMNLKKAHSDGKIKYDTFTGRTHTEETKAKLRMIDRSGSKNSQFGTRWITDGKTNKKIKKDEKLPKDFYPGRS
jgi:hypothetical protein